MTDTEVESFYSFGYAHYSTGSWMVAEDTFRVLCTNRPLEPRFWFALGATLQEKRDYWSALYSWAMVALLKKEDPYPHFHAAECCFSLARLDDAAKALYESEERVQRDPQHPLRDKIDLLRKQWGL